MDSFPHYRNASQFWIPPSTAKDIFVCEFVAKENALHFAHTMQQLYACFSYWQTYENNASKPILLLSPKVQAKLERNPFLKGFLQVLQKSQHVQIMGKVPFLETYDTTSIRIQTMDVVGGYVLSHAEVLHQLVQQPYSSSVNNATNNDDTATARSNNITKTVCSSSSPRIAILNRRKANGRSILNSEKLVKAISNATGQKDSSISVTYFEGDVTFRDQVPLFQQVDILLSPHGAQLAGAAFLAPCSQLLEVFPHNYVIPAFFGSLAANVGASYAYLYLSDRPPANDTNTNLSDRVRARATNLCPSTTTIVDAIQELIQDWRQCCQTYQQRPS
jgi:hypothetical protein